MAKGIIMDSYDSLYLMGHDLLDLVNAANDIVALHDRFWDIGDAGPETEMGFRWFVKLEWVGPAHRTMGIPPTLDYDFRPHVQGFIEIADKYDLEFNDG